MRRFLFPADHRVLPWVALLGLTGVVGVVVPCFAQVAPQQPVPPHEVRGTLPQPAADATAELLTLQARLRTVRAQTLEQEDSQLRRLRELAAEERALARTLEALTQDRDRKERQLTEQATALSNRKEQAETLTAKHRELCSVVEAVLVRVRTQVESSIPWRRATRLAAIERAREVLGGEGTPAGGLASVARIQRDEEALGRLVESGTLQLEVEGQAVAVKGFHLGQLAVVFANEDGSVVGFCRPGQELEDGLAAARAQPTAAVGYQQIVDILERRRTPGLVDLFLPELPLTKGAGQ